MSSILETIVCKGAVGHGTFFGVAASDRDAPFEFALMPLSHTGSSVSHILGTITAIDRLFWFGSESLVALELRDVGLLWPDGSPPEIGVSDPKATKEARRKLRILPGGLSR